MTDNTRINVLAELKAQMQSEKKAPKLSQENIKKIKQMWNVER